MDANFKIKGLDELNKELKRLPENFRTSALNGATKMATIPLKEAAVAFVPVGTGNLKESIMAGLAPKKERVSKWESKHKVKIKPKGKIKVKRWRKGQGSYMTSTTFYARMVEEGTSKMPARPFMRTAFTLKRRESVAKFREALDKKIAFYNRKIQRLRG